MRDKIETLYRNMYCEGTLNNLESQNRWKEAYLSIGKTIKTLLEDKK